MDIFEQSDLQKLQNGINASIRGQQADDAAQEEQNEKDSEFNEKLSALTEPFAQELLRKPIEKIGERAFGKVAKGVRSAVGKGINKIKGAVQQRLEGAVNDLAQRAGVNPDSITGAARTIGAGGEPLQALPTGSDLATAASKAATPLNSSIPDDARSALNNVRARSGQQPISNPADEAQEVDAFTGKPVVNKLDQPAPPTQPDDSVGDDFENSPIVRASDAPGVSAKPPLPETPAPPSLETGEATRTTQSLEDILPLKQPADDVSSLPSFKPQPVFQPKPTPGDTPLATGPRDSLAPMRDAMKNTNSPEQNSDLLRQYRSTAQDDPATLLKPGPEGPPAPPAPAPDAPPASTGAAPPTPDAPPAPDAPPQHAPVPSEDGAGTGTVTTEVGEEAGDDIAKAAAKTASKDIAEQAGKAVLTSEAALGGPEDPLADIVGALAGIGTLLGGVFGQHHTKVATATAVPTVGTAQQGVY